MKSSSIEARVYYEDTDAGGIVYYANYLKFCERGRTELLRFVGFENKSLMDREGLVFVVRRVEADYLSPAYLDDVLTIKTEITEIGNASFSMRQTILRESTTLFDMTVLLVCVNRQGRPARLPADLRSALIQAHLR